MTAAPTKSFNLPTPHGSPILHIDSDGFNDDLDDTATLTRASARLASAQTAKQITSLQESVKTLSAYNRSLQGTVDSLSKRLLQLEVILKQEMEQARREKLEAQNTIQELHRQNYENVRKLQAENNRTLGRINDRVRNIETLLEIHDGKPALGERVAGSDRDEGEVTSRTRRRMDGRDDRVLRGFEALEALRGY